MPLDRSARLNIRLDAETRVKVERIARYDGRNLSQTVRTLLRAALAQRRLPDNYSKCEHAMQEPGMPGGR